jgi:Zn-dependent protease
MLHEALSGILATLAAIILHELAHGLAALALGDTTAKRAGRLTLNPLKHIDKVGSVFLPIFLAVSQLATIGRVAFMFGWAKPVPIDPMALNINGNHNPRRLMAIVAIAGPAMNFVLAILAAFALRFGYGIDFLIYFILVNLVLGIFNLIPLPPMDGGRIAVGLLPLPAARLLARSEKFGIILVFLVLFLLPTTLAQFGVHFNPFQDALNVVLPWANNGVLHLAGEQKYGT